MMQYQIFALLTTAALLSSCRAEDTSLPMSGGTADAAADGSAPDGAVDPGDPCAIQTAAAELPTWTLEDIQPLSPKFQETYGLSEFGGKILVAVVVQGF